MKTQLRFFAAIAVLPALAGLAALAAPPARAADAPTNQPAPASSSPASK